MSPDFWDEAACAKVRAAMHSGQAEPAEINRDGFVVDEQVRKTYDVEVAPEIVIEVERSLAAARPGIARFFGTTLTGAEGPGFLRYPLGGLYRAHRDRMGNSGDGFPRLISVVLFLSTATAGTGDACCGGGALRLYGAADPGNDAVPLDIAPVAGTLVAFPSDLLHEVLPVTAGVRDVVVDWFY